MLRIAIAAALAAALLQAAPARATPACDLPPESAAEAGPLPNAARALAGGSLAILAIGSASISAGSGPGTSWPARLQAVLQARFPGREIGVSTRGGRGVTVADHLALLGTGTAGVALVVWQAGTVEAVRGLDADEMGAGLVEGIERLRAAGADVVLMDPQFSRFLRANANVDPYLEKLRMTAIATGVPLLRSYELMQDWAESGVVDVERAARGARAATVNQLNDCLGRALGDMIAHGIAAAR